MEGEEDFLVMTRIIEWGILPTHIFDRIGSQTR